MSIPHRRQHLINILVIPKIVIYMKKDKDKLSKLSKSDRDKVGEKEIAKYIK